VIGTGVSAGTHWAFALH